MSDRLKGYGVVLRSFVWMYRQRVLYFGRSGCNIGLFCGAAFHMINEKYSRIWDDCGMLSA